MIFQMFYYMVPVRFQVVARMLLGGCHGIQLVADSLLVTNSD